MRALIALFLVVLGVLWLSRSPDDRSQANKVAEARNTDVDRYIAQQQRLLSVKISKFSWQKGGFDNVMLATLTIENTNDFAVKDVDVRCEHTANSGTLIDANTRTIYEAIKPKSSKTVRGFNMGFINTQASRSSCHVTGFVNG
ncbi:hypothetical protein [Bradyrhizobium sp. TM233]|uniref:hypothetical protein n=1 Tax=Bradyrhizobium sp. TM233 TaxID=2599801 RepID=UPI0027D59575|nr:hypothetical protein TM233_58770 [Bradyrhizobium sp. TM233]